MKTLLALLLSFAPATGAVVSFNINCTVPGSFTFYACPNPGMTDYMTISKPSQQWKITSENVEIMADGEQALMLLPGEATAADSWPTTNLRMDMWAGQGARGFLGTITNGYHGITDLSINRNGTLTVYSVSYETDRYTPIYAPVPEPSSAILMLIASAFSFRPARCRNLPWKQT